MTADEVFIVLKECAKVYKHFPTIQEFAHYSELSVDVTTKLYKRWCTQNKLVKNGDSYDFYKEDPNKLFAEEKKQEPDNMIIPKTRNKNPQPEKKDYKNIAIRSIVGFIGVLLVLNSVHFTFEFNHLSMKLFWAFTLSVSIVTFMSIAFTLAHYTSEKYLKAFILFLWLLGFTYSVFTAVSGQYNDFRKYLSTDKSEVVDSQKTILNNQLNIYSKKQKELLHWREQETEYSLNPDLKTENPGTWKKIQDGIIKLEECENKIEELQDKIMNIVEVDVVSEETVYSWLCKILGISSNKLHFIVVLFPAIFIDLCSGVCLMFALKKKE